MREKLAKYSETLIEWDASNGITLFSYEKQSFILDYFGNINIKQEQELLNKNVSYFTIITFSNKNIQKKKKKRKIATKSPYVSVLVFQSFLEKIISKFTTAERFS